MADSKPKSSRRRAYEQSRRLKLQSALGDLRAVVTSIGNVKDSDCNNNSDVLSAATFMLKMLIPPIYPATVSDGAPSEVELPLMVTMESPNLASSSEIQRKGSKKTKRSDVEEDVGDRKPKKAKIELTSSGESNDRAEEGWDHRRVELEELEKLKEILKHTLGQQALGSSSSVDNLRDSAPAFEHLDSVNGDGDSMNIDSQTQERPMLKFSSDCTPTDPTVFVQCDSLTSSSEYNGIVDSMRCELMLRTLDETSEADHFVPLEAVLPSEATSMGLPWNISGRYDDWSPRSSMTDQEDSNDSEDDLDTLDWSREWENL